MKKFGTVALFLAFFSFQMLAQNTAYYTVLVGNFLDAKAQDFETFKGLGFLHANTMDGNLTQVFIGGYEKKRDAEKVAASIRSKGYSSASVQERILEEGKTTTVIQLGIRNIKKKIKWERYFKAGDLYVILNGNQIKITTGLYSSINEAKKNLGEIRKLGFSDAFVKPVNDVFLHKVNSFEAGGLKRPLFDLTLDEEPNKKKRKDIPKGYEDDDVRPKTPIVTDPKPPRSTSIPAAYGTESALPKIRSKIKRRSAIELQKALKAQNAYTGSLDGYYGNGTSSAYKKVLKQNRDLQKYQLLAQYMNSSGQSSSSELQNIVNNLIDDPMAPTKLDRYRDPIAKAYRAYLLYTTLGTSSNVNSLMNEAIKESFSGKKIKNQAPFDYNATYAYEDLGQLILHIHYIHSAPDNDIAAPCWLFQMHPRETANAYKAYSSASNENFKLQACDEFMFWPEIRMAQTIAVDLNPDQSINQAKVAAAASERARLFLSPTALSNKEKTAAEKWNQKIWDGLNSWAARDALHERMVDAFKVAYFQSQVRLEDYYMGKGFKLKDAQALAIATMQSIVGPHLERFD